MPDSFIFRLDESSTVKATDYAAFDVFDSNLGDFYTKKINFGTLSNTISSSVMALIQTKLDVLSFNINEAKAIALQKLDRRGYQLDRQIERMTGILVLNDGFSALNNSDFNGYLNVHNYGIYNLATPISNFDAVNKIYVDTIKDGLSSAISAINTALTGYLMLSGGVMTGILTTKGVDMSGYRITNLAAIDSFSLSSDAVDRGYVDSIKWGLSSAISAINTALTGYLMLSGGVMTGILTTKGVDMSGYRITRLANIDTTSLSTEAVNKGYVDTINWNLSSAISAINTALTGYLMLSGGVMTGILTTKGVDMSGYRITRLANIDTTSLSTEAVNKGYVDSIKWALSSAVSASNTALTGYLMLSGGVMTGVLTTRGIDMSGYRITRLANIDTTSLSTEAVNKGYVDDRNNSRLALSGGALTGPLTLKGYSETVGTFTIDTHNTFKYYNFDLNTGTVFEIDMIEKLSAFKVTNEPTNSYTLTLVIKQNSTTLYKLSSWKINMNPVKWAGFSPQITQSSNAIDIFAITKIGTNWYGFIGGQNYI
jgi:hypothetical protein